MNRDTTFVVRELFEAARHSVLVATFALDGGEKVRPIFEPLAARLDASGGDNRLDVTLIVNILRKPGNGRAADAVVSAWAAHLRDYVWPGKVLPAVYFDPRALAADGTTRARMHAKRIAIDDRVAFVTSANFTEAAQWRNVEVGLVVRNSDRAHCLASQLRGLVAAGRFVRVPL